MKKISVLAVAVLAMLTACNGDKLRNAEAENDQLRGDLRETLATQDSLLVLVNDISEGMSQIKDLERIIATPGALGSESASRKEQIKNDMIVIQQALQERRQRLEELEKKLQASSGENSTLRKTIQTLKTQIAEQQTEIATLTNQLASANVRIKELDNTIAGLNTTVDSLSTTANAQAAERARAEAEALAAENELNECFYAIGTGKELKAKKILEKKFLGKTKVMKGDFDESYFTAGDKRTLTSIPTHSKKAKIMTGQPKDSYEIEDQNGQKVIRITNPAKFWQLSSFLVIQVD